MLKMPRTQRGNSIKGAGEAFRSLEHILLEGTFGEAPGTSIKPWPCAASPTATSSSLL